jgi:hypothetical protein
VRVESPTNLNATYASGGTNTNIFQIDNGTDITFFGYVPVVGAQFFTSTGNGLLANTPYFIVALVGSACQISLTYGGTPVTGLTNGGVTLPSVVNPGVGATLTNAGTQAALVIDGVTLSVSDRVLIYTQTTQTQNGVYVVTDVGSGSTNWVLTRSSDTNTYGIAGPTTLSEGSTFFVQQGATGAGETYTCNTQGTIVFGTTNITFAQVSATQIYTGTSPINVTGTVISLTTVPVNLGGTNITSYTAGDLLYATGSTTLTKLPIGASGRVLKSTGSVPDWQLNPTYLPVVLHSGSTVQISVASGFLPVLLHDGVTIVNVALF